jgi:hypothetical protein
MTSPATAARAAAAAAVFACGGVLLAACGSGGGSAAAPTTVTATVTATPSTSAPPPTGTSVSPHVSGPPECATSGLAVKLGAGNGAAGSTFIPIVFTNTTGSTCSMFGYPGVSFVTGQGGSQIGSAAMRDSTQPARTIVLAAGGVAHATLRVVQALNFPSAACKPVTANTLKIFPPGQTEPLYISFTAMTCASTSPAEQVLFVQTVGSGTGAS